MTSLMVILSIFDQRAWWSYPNLLAGHFYGVRALSAGAGWPTLSGLALQLTIAAVAGAFFALFFSGLTSGARLALVGMLWGSALFFVSEFVHGLVTPLVGVHIQRGPVLAAHAVYGLFLASIPHRERSQPAADPAGVPDPPAVEVLEHVPPDVDGPEAEAGSTNKP